MRNRKRMQPAQRAEIIEWITEGLVCLMAFAELAALGMIMLLMGGA